LFAQDWLACADPHAMLPHLRVKASTRKLRLLAAACCRRIWHVLLDERLQRAVEVAERSADGAASTKELAAARAATRAVGGLAYESSVVRAVWSATRRDIRPAVSVACLAANMALGKYLSCTRLGKKWSVGVTEPLVPHYTADAKEEEKKQAVLVRDIFGNPYRPVTLASAWRTANVVALAQSIYDERAFDRLPILADALEDAGCDNAEVLNHCRRPSVHVRGCWAVDLLLGER
jgi:hypothetical protein